MIFKRVRGNSYKIIRKITITQERIIIKDNILNVGYNNNIFRAPRSSKRHVASADCFHAEDLLTMAVFKEKRKLQGIDLLVETEYLLKN